MNTLINLSNEELVEYYRLFKKGQDKTHRFEKNKIHQMEIKFMYNLVRLLEECDQILSECDLDLMRSKELLKTIKRGDWTQEQVEDYFYKKEKTLEELYAKSDLPAQPDEKKARQILIEILQYQYGSLEKHLPKPSNAAENLIEQVKQLIKDQGF